MINMVVKGALGSLSLAEAVWKSTGVEGGRLERKSKKQALPESSSEGQAQLPQSGGHLTDFIAGESSTHPGGRVALSTPTPLPPGGGSLEAGEKQCSGQGSPGALRPGWGGASSFSV